MSADRTTVDLYGAAGVRVDVGNEAARRYARLAARTARPGVATDIGGFGGGFRIDTSRYPEPLLVSGTDGVGTKLKLAFATDRHDTVGIDCVAMCVNDILCLGAEPLYFLDYFATGALDADRAEAVVAGVAVGCELAGCALLGGETAEMPGMYAPGEYDLAGFAVGIVNAPDVIDGSALRPGDVLLGLASNGIHSNGFSLVRKTLADAGVSLDAKLPGWRGTVAEELLRPTRIYAPAVLGARAAGQRLLGMAHVTGGGLVDNLPRCLPAGLSLEIDPFSWPEPAVFRWLREQLQMGWHEAARVWNLGIGFAIVVRPQAVDAVAATLRGYGETVWPIGRVVAGDGGLVWSGAGERLSQSSAQQQTRVRLAVFASGAGSNLQALLDVASDDRFPAVVSLVVSDVPDCAAVQRASAAGVPVFAAHPREFANKQAFESAVLSELQRRRIQLVVLAGYMRIVGPTLLSVCAGRMLNIHPSLLPLFPGKQAVHDAFAAGAAETGVTVHWVDAGVDTGPVIAQRTVAVDSGMSETDLRTRIQAVEHQLYPDVIRRVAAQFLLKENNE